MNNLIEWLSQNPIIVLVMFIISLISGLMGIVLGWKRFYEDYLSKSVSIPIWIIVIIFISMPAIFTILVGSKPIEDELKELSLVEGKKFGIQQVVLDGKRFIRCSFDGTELIFNGEHGFDFSENNLKSNFRLSLNKNARLTFEAFYALYKDPAFRPIVENTFQAIREGKKYESSPLFQLKE